MIIQLKQLLCWGEFVEWVYKVDQEYPYKYEMGWGFKHQGEWVTDRELLALCIEYLDSKGIYVHIKPFPYMGCVAGKMEFSFSTEIFANDGLHLFEKLPLKLVRHEATEAGIIKAFEIRSEQLKKEE